MAWDSTWEDVFTSQEWGKYPGEDVIRFIARNFYHVAERKDIKILEVGSGTGANLWFIAREGFSVFAIEGSPTAVNKAIQRLDLEVPEWVGEIRCGDFTKLPYSDCSFDAVIDVEAITHNPFDDAVNIYSEIHRVLKPRGKLYSRTFAKGTLGDETGKVLSHNCYLPEVGPIAGKGLTRFTDESEIPALLKLFSKIDFGDISRTENKQLITKEWCITATK
ncbi:methyltransferase domain-containing protein [Pseudoalteromonas xiamenensis]|uniref:class I SAM-dependent methyltransferase n=1 Tax=Pseudoalteromonas xiamenensis TaxID=882626 RepID=UPI0027E3EE87|nr:methyltransferase domain-containing protein [Pseudoalteromonas xiamenensis]WMN59383.1 methyltransferase domain-containing protein [Pseudoalteromonas xiamenensis]